MFSWIGGNIFCGMCCGDISENKKQKEIRIMSDILSIIIVIVVVGAFIEGVWLKWRK